MADDGSSSPAVQITPQDRDIAIRTMLGEESTPEGMAGVASTMLNRAQSGQYGGRTLTGVALAPNQFTSWTDNAPGLLKYSPSDPAYVAAGKIFDGVASGQIPDFTNGGTHFYAPQLGAQQGRNAPAWAKGQPIPLGKTLFYAPQGPVNYQPPASAAIQNASNTPAPAAPKGFVGSMAEEKPAKGAPQPDIVEQFLKPLPGQASNPGAPSAPASASAAQSGPDIVDQFLKPLPAPAPNTAALPTTNRMAGAEPGPNGLIWNDNGGFDPKTGELVVGGKPPGQSSPAVSTAGSALTGFVSGMPVIGAPLLSGVEKGAAAIRSLREGQPYADELAGIQSASAQDVAQHPTANTIGSVAGGIAGTAPAMIAAPELCGVKVGAPIVQNMLMGAGSSAAISAVDALTRYGLNVPAIERATISGGIVGGAAPAVGAALGAVGGKIVNMLSGTTPGARNVANIIAQSGMTPADANAAVQSFGPNATLADASELFKTHAGALAAQGGDATTMLKNAFAARAAGADNRVSQAIDTALGPKPDLTATQDAIYQKAQAAAGPSYNAARSIGQPLDITPVLSSIDQQLSAGAVGGEEKVLKTAKSYLADTIQNVPGPNGTTTSLVVPKEDPGALLKARQALDDMIQKAPQNPDTSAGRNAMRALNNIRGQLDAVLKTDPNIEAGDAAYAEQMKLKDAVEAGTELFKRGTRLEDFQRTLAAASPDEADAMRQGARVAIGDALDEARQGTLAGARSMFGKASANRAKLDALFPNAGDVFDMLHGEAQMRSTEQSVIGNSKTAERQAVGQQYGVQPAGAATNVGLPLLGSALDGGTGAVVGMAGQMAAHNIKNAFTQAAMDRLKSQTAQALSASGSDLSPLMDQISRAYRTRGINNAFTSAPVPLAAAAFRGANPDLVNMLTRPAQAQSQ
jgi:hypothetical protein